MLCEGSMVLLLLLRAGGCSECFGRTGGGFIHDWRFALMSTDVVPDDGSMKYMFGGCYCCFCCLVPGGGRSALHVLGGLVVALWMTDVYLALLTIMY